MIRRLLPPKTAKKIKPSFAVSVRVPFWRYAENPVGYCIEILGIQPTQEQRLILESVRDRAITNVKAAHGVGKSLVAAVLVLWWVFAVGGLAVTTAPTEDQVKEILWSEVRKLYNKYREKLGGRCGELFVKFSETARAYGFSSRNYDVNSFQGKHGEYLLLIGDEYDGITDIIDDGFRSCLTGSSNRGLRIGNPLDPQSSFAKACGSDKGCITIAAWSHPNISWAYQEVYVDRHNPQVGTIHRLKPEVAEKVMDKDGKILDRHLWKDDPLLIKDSIPGAISIKWIEDVRAEKFENSAFWISRVEGEYPTDKADGIIPRSYLIEARQRYDSDPDYWEAKTKDFGWRLGLDVGDGGDPHALAVWRGPVLYWVTIHPTLGDRLDTTRAADIAAIEMRSLGGESRIAVDSTGVGAGTLATLLNKGWNAIACNFGESPKDKKRFFNKKAELYWSFRELLGSGSVAIAPLGDKEDYIFDDLTATRYDTTTKEQIKCEPKEKTKARLKRSPDSEAAIIALAIPASIGSVVSGSFLSMPEGTYTSDDLAELSKMYRRF